MARSETNERNRLISASIGLAIPTDRDTYGYLSEHHAYGETDEESGEYTEDLAAQMLATTQGIEFDPDVAWKEREQVFKMGGKIVRTLNITQSAVGRPHRWTCVIALAVFIPIEEHSQESPERGLKRQAVMALPAGWLGQQDNFLGIDEPWCHPDQAGVYVLPAPYEHTSSYILGSDRGPSAIIEASQQVELYDETLRYEPYREWGGVATAATLNLDGRVDGQAVQSIQDFVQPHVGLGKFLVTLTGEHTGALGAIRAHATTYPTMCVLQIDAHGDLRHAYQGNPYSHASVMARVVQDGLSLVQVGVRSISPEEIELIDKTPRIKTFFAASILDPSGPYEGRAARWIPDVLAACTGRSI